MRLPPFCIYLPYIFVIRKIRNSFESFKCELTFHNVVNFHFCIKNQTVRLLFTFLSTLCIFLGSGTLPQSGRPASGPAWNQRSALAKPGSGTLPLFEAGGIDVFSFFLFVVSEFVAKRKFNAAGRRQESVG